MDTDVQKQAALFILFGASGDLSWRLIVPALFTLYLDRHLPERFILVGVSNAMREKPHAYFGYRGKHTKKWR